MPLTFQERVVIADYVARGATIDEACSQFGITRSQVVAALDAAAKRVFEDMTDRERSTLDIRSVGLAKFARRFASKFQALAAAEKSK